MQKITPFLMFPKGAEEAAKLYTSLFPNARIVEQSYMNTEGAPGGAARAYTGTIEIGGQRLRLMDGGPTFSFAEGMSLFVDCETQEEIDRYCAALIAGGGEQGPCGWLKDRFGVSWQIVPSVLGELLGDTDRQKAQRTLQAMLQMKKLDIAALRRAHDGKAA
jgi:predicted 3-demethylubiquinone-9 3-methyltransferase (glyoxalase superfamily)